jgi:26S proteasome regulatory subunit N10
MVLEATMIVVDNSEFTRNGDYPTNRYEAQLDVVDLLFQAKTNANRENTVGLLCYGGDGPRVLSTLTTDYGNVLTGIHSTKIDGTLHFSTGIQVAALALKHRQNKVQHQRIVAFVASPIEESEKDLERLAKKMKKNNIAVDFINFGEDSLNTAKLERFVSIVNSHDNSHILTLPADDNRLLYEAVGSSEIVLGEEGAAAAASMGAGTGSDFDFGADANMDPDLALALRLSLEEEQARQAREAHARDQQEMETVQENHDGDTNMDDAK